jgi:dihydropteroate synthase
MGILNITPDSFADGGLYLDPGAAEAAAKEMEARGADIIDVGGESTRPGSETISAEEEVARILPVLERLSRSLTIPISIDTSKPEVAEVAVGEGASIINDVTGLRGASGPSEARSRRASASGGGAPRALRGAGGPSEAHSRRASASGSGAPRALRYDASLAEIAARSGAGLILMHARGRSRDMYKDANYASVRGEVSEELRVSLDRALAAGARRDCIVLDPGLGFAKRPEHSYAALAALPAFAALGCPLLVGPSRKSFLSAAIGERAPADRDMATAASVAAAVLLGAHIVRVHNVPAMVDVARVADAIRDGDKRC